MTLEQLFEDFGIACGLSKLRLDGNGCCSLVFDDAYEMTFTYDDEDEALLFSAPVVNATTNRAPMLRHILETNYLGLRTRGGTLAIDPERGIYVYWKRHDAAAFHSANDLKNAVEKFLTEFIRLRNAVDDAARQGDTMPGKDLPPDAWLLSV